MLTIIFGWLVIGAVCGFLSYIEVVNCPAAMAEVTAILDDFEKEQEEEFVGNRTFWLHFSILMSMLIKRVPWGLISIIYYYRMRNKIKAGNIKALFR